MVELKLEPAGCDEHLSLLLARVSDRLSGVPELDLQVRVACMNTFDGFTESQTRLDVRKTGAVFVREKGIFLNLAVFLGYPEREQLAIIAHELAHAFQDRVAGSTKPLADAIPDGFTNEMLTAAALVEAHADWLVCEWGMKSELCALRLRDYGESYVAGLDAFPDQEAFLRLIGMYFWRKIATG